MAFLLSKKIPAFSPADPPSSAAATTGQASTLQSSYRQDYYSQGADRAPVTSCLHIKSSFSSSSAAGPSKDAVLRRIRHHKRALQIQEAVRTHLAFLSDEAEAANGSRNRWIDDSDAFSP